MKVLLIVAMKSELESFLNKLEYETIIVSGLVVYKTNINNVTLYIGKTEAGKVNAAMITTALILKLKPSYVINAGIGGGLTSSLELLDVVASTKVAYHDFDLTAFGNKIGELDDHTLYFNASKKLLSLLPYGVKKGLIVSGDQFVSGIDKMNKIKNDFKKALVCDMEGAAIAHVATLLSKKFVIIRAISDNVYLPKHVDVYKDYKYLAIDKVSTIVINLLKSM